MHVGKFADPPWGHFAFQEAVWNAMNNDLTEFCTYISSETMNG
jgi:hypothetical protein